MIEEFAVDPVLLGTDFKTARFYLDQMGYDFGRVLVRCPKEYWKQVQQGIGLAQAPDVKKKRWSLLINRARRSSRLRHNRPEGSSSDDWIEYALRSHQSCPFRLIISSTAHEHDCVVHDDDVSSHPSWSVPRSRRVDRSAEAIADVIEPAVRGQSEIHLVDQYFKPEKADTLTELLDRLTGSGRRVELVWHLNSDKWSNEKARTYLQEECQRRLGRCLSPALSLRFRLHSEEEHDEGIHNRYVLTRDVGIILGWGFDTSPGQKDDVSLMSEEQLDELRDQWCNARPLFEFDVVAQSTATSAKRT